jgi:hypothetical protein
MTEMMSIGEEPFRIGLIPFISPIPISPFSYSKDFEVQPLETKYRKQVAL